MDKIFSFVGASHTGKTTLGKFLSENYNIEYREVSARPFLDKDVEDSYEKQIDDYKQNRIMYNNLESVYEAIFDAALYDKKIVLSRCCIDVLAYARTLKKGLTCESLQEETIKKLKDKIVILYTVPDFPMSEEDKLRGNNEIVRAETDTNIFNILTDLNIPFYLLKGSLEERQHKLEDVMLKYGILKK